LIIALDKIAMPALTTKTGTTMGGKLLNIILFQAAWFTAVL
jgi:hypothetical protein